MMFASLAGVGGSGVSTTTIAALVIAATCAIIVCIGYYLAWRYRKYRTSSKIYTNSFFRRLVTQYKHPMAPGGGGGNEGSCSPYLRNLKMMSVFCVRLLRQLTFLYFISVRRRRRRRRRVQLAMRLYEVFTEHGETSIKLPE